MAHFSTDLNRVTYRMFAGEELYLPFRSPLTSITNKILTDYYLESWAAGQSNNFTSDYAFEITVDSNDPTLGYIHTSPDATYDTRDGQIFVRVYGISKVDNTRIVLFAGLIEIMQ